jgi:hypothetical protein
MTKNTNPAPTAPAACDTEGCEHDQEIGIRILVAPLAGREFRMCVTDATRVYDLRDRNRVGGKVELFDL